MPLSMPDDEIRRRHKWGCPVKILADLNGCDQKAIREVLREEENMSRFDWEEARKMYDAGMSDPKIGDILGCSSVTVLTWRRKNDLPTKCHGFGRPPKKAVPMVESEAVTVGAINQSLSEAVRKPATVNAEFDAMFIKPVIEVPPAEMWLEEVEDYQNDIDDLLHGWYVQNERSVEIIEGMSSNRQAIRERLQMERKVLIGMLMVAGFRDIEAMLKEVIGND